LSLLVEIPQDTIVSQEMNEKVDTADMLVEQTEEKEETIALNSQNKGDQEVVQQQVQKHTAEEQTPAETEQKELETQQKESNEQQVANVEEQTIKEEQVKTKEPTLEHTEETTKKPTASDAAPIIFKNILFDFDRSFLRDMSKQELEKLYAYMVAHPDITLEINGHTDWIGAEEYNMALGGRRSTSAVNYLLSKGIEKGRIVWRSFGESQPVAPNALPSGKDNPEGRQLNRRCEFTIGGRAQSYNITLKF
ncbi:MAG: OmpA family protein, partial [Flavobacteriales bacterium]